MARLVGVDLPREKRLEVALQYIFGIGETRAKATLAATGVSPDIRVKDLQEPDLIKLREYIEANYKIEGDLRREIAGDIRRKVEIPGRGQRTHTNARTRKGPRVAIAGKKKETK
jgi:small subunit ribosomal protein S13